MVQDPDERVQFQLACTLGQLQGEPSFRVLRQIAFRHISNKWFKLAVLTAAAEDATRWFRALTSSGGLAGQPSKGAEELLAQLTSILGARQKDREIAGVLARVEKSRSQQDAWWQSASLAGLAEGLRRGPERRVKLPTGQPLLVRLMRARSPEIENAALRVLTQIDLAVSPELRAMLARAATMAIYPEARLEERTRAIGILGLDPTASTLSLLEKCLSPQQPQEVQVATVSALANLRIPEVTAVLLHHWRTYTGPVREATLSAFFNDRSRLLALLDAIKTDKVQPWSLTRAMKLQLLRSPDREIKEKAKVLLETSAESDRKAVFQKYQSALQLSGNSKRGQQIFEEICNKCHKIGNQGYEVGPDLLSVLSRPKSQLMTDILMPNLNVENGYEEYLAQTADGSLITGVIAKQSPTAVTLRRAKGEEDTILRSSLTNLRSLSLSAMPEDLDKSISIEGMADLLAYLKSLR